MKSDLLISNAPVLFVTAKRAANLLDMKEKEFLDLVAIGALPSPKRIGQDVVRWDVLELYDMIAGKARMISQDMV